MPIHIEVPGQGVIEFPDDMSDVQIEQAIQKNFGNQLSSDPTAEMSGTETFLAGAGKAFADFGRGIKQRALEVTPSLGRMYGLKSQGTEQLLAPKKAEVQKEIDQSRITDAPLMKTNAGFLGNVTGNTATALPFSFIPGSNTPMGSAAIGSAMGYLQPTATGESVLKNTAIGGAAGLTGNVIGAGLGRTIQAAGNRVATIEANTAAKAAAEAAAETASARSAAGNAAQNVYRQLEHLRELGAKGLLTPEQAQVAAQLEKELAEKAAEKLLPAAAQKEATAKAFDEASKTEGKRAADLAAKRLSGQEVRNQVMARLKRYGPAALGGAIGHSILPGIGAGAGIAAGLYLRPALRSVVNLAKNPAVQHKLLTPVANIPMLANPAVPQIMGLLGPSIYAAQQ